MIPELRSPHVELLGQQPGIAYNLVARVAPSPVDPKLGHGIVKICVMGVFYRTGDGRSSVSSIEVRKQPRRG